LEFILKHSQQSQPSKLSPITHDLYRCNLNP